MGCGTCWRTERTCRRSSLTLKLVSMGSPHQLIDMTVVDLYKTAQLVLPHDHQIHRRWNYRLLLFLDTDNIDLPDMADLHT
jgi:hypothetical protein